MVIIHPKMDGRDLIGQSRLVSEPTGGDRKTYVSMDMWPMYRPEKKGTEYWLSSELTRCTPSRSLPSCAWKIGDALIEAVMKSCQRRSL